MTHQQDGARGDDGGPKHTPGPWIVRESKTSIVVDGPNGIRVLRYAYSTNAKSIAEVMDGVGMKKLEERERAREGNARQMADLRLIAAAPDLYAACRDNMTDPNDEIPDTRPFSALQRHLASLMEEKKRLAHMATEKSTSAAGWAKLLRAKADQLDAALTKAVTP